MYSLIGNTKLNGLNPYLWLGDMLARLPSHTVKQVAELLPLANYKWAKHGRLVALTPAFLTPFATHPASTCMN